MKQRKETKCTVTLWKSLSAQILIVVVAPISGGVVSTTVGVNEQLPVLPFASVAVHVTEVLEPNAK